MKLRPAGPADAETVLALVRELATYEREPEAVLATGADYARWLAADPAPFGCLLAEVDGETAGFALWTWTFSTWTGRRTLWLEDVFVREAWRRRGVGRALLAELGRVAAQGAARLDFAVLDWNRPAIAFYREIGARPLGGWTIWRVEEALERLGTG